MQAEEFKGCLWQNQGKIQSDLDAVVVCLHLEDYDGQYYNIITFVLCSQSCFFF